MRKILILLMLSTALPAYAQQADPARLDEIKRERDVAKAREAALAKESKNIQSEIAKLKKELVTAAAEAEGFEKTGRSHEIRLSNLGEEEATLTKAMYADRATLMQLLAALQSVEINPPPALAMLPNDASDAARAAQLMATLSKDMKARAEDLAVQLEDLTNLRENISSERTSLASNEKYLERRRAEIKKLVTEKAALEKSISADRELELVRVAALAAEADSLRDLITNLEASTNTIEPRVKPEFGDPDMATSGVPRVKPKAGTRLSAELALPPDGLRFADARGSLRSPVNGRVTESFGGKSKGITVSARGQAQVITPYNARVEFAGPFKNYENVVILNVGDGYFILLTGIGDMYASTGAMVNAGEPLGLMPLNAQQSTNLYIEFRKNGTPINPTPWLGTAIAEAG